MLKLYGKKKLLLAFEYGLMIQRVATEHKIELTPEIVERAEKLIEGEFASRTPEQLATWMTPNILAIFEVDTSQ